MTQFRQAVLLYNPMSGQRRARRAARIAAAIAELQRAGVTAEAVPTHGPGTAGRQAAAAIAAGCDLVVACGGDGTVHEVIQGVVNTSAALGVIPLGTANSLAADIGVPRAPAAAVRSLLEGSAIRIAAGRMEYQRDGATQSRYFTVAVGVGPDAHLFYTLNATAKHRLGYAAYYAEALRIWATHKYPLFEVEYMPSGASASVRHQVSQVLAVRITDFGGLLRRLAPGAALARPDLRLVLFRTRSKVRYLRYVTAVMLGREPHIPGIELVDATAVQCRPHQAGRIYAEADGELLGTLPVRLTVVPDALTLLLPQKPQR